MGVSLWQAVCAAMVALASVNIVRQLVASSNAFNSVTVQSFHYFSRPHDAVTDDKIAAALPRLRESRSAWVGSDISRNSSAYMTVLNEPQRQELRNAVAAAAALVAAGGASMASLSAADLPLPTLSSEVSRWKRELQGVNGLGFHVIRGIPVESWTSREQEVFAWAFGRQLGTPGAQNNEGDLLGHVKDVGADPLTARQYKTNARILPHCDAADVVGLLCVPFRLNDSLDHCSGLH